MEIPYQHIYCSRNEKMLQHTRRQIVQYALAHSIRKAAKKFGVARNTVTLWVRRWKESPGAPLVDREPVARARHPKQMDRETEMKIIRIVTLRLSRGQPINISRLVREEKIPYSVNAVIRCLKRHGDVYGKKKKAENNQKRFPGILPESPPGVTSANRY